MTPKKKARKAVKARIRELIQNGGSKKEFQARDYDAMVAHTTLVCVRYLLLSIENRESKDDRSWGGIFYEMCEEVENISFAQAFVILLIYLLRCFGINCTYLIIYWKKY
jgi:hypothetical protein